MYTNEDVIKMRDEDGLSWPMIEELTGWDREKCRSIVRRAHGTHEKEGARKKCQRIRLPLGGTSYEEAGNVAVASCADEIITSLDKLLEVCQVDTDVWKVTKSEVSSWGQHSKTHGYKSLYRVKAWLERKTPIVTEWPLVAPVMIEGFEKVEFEIREPTELGCALVVPDSQTGFWRDLDTGKLRPFHDRKALDVTLQVAEDLQPDTIVFLGDDLDLPEWTEKFYKMPEFYFTTQPALVERAWWLGQYRRICPHARLVYCQGNHEARLPKSIVSNHLASYKLRSVDNLSGPPAISVEGLLCLDQLGIEFVGDYPNGRYWVNDNLSCEHGDVARGQSGATVRAVVNDLRYSVIFGHIHRVEMASKTVFPKGRDITYVAISAGTLARIGSIVPARKKRLNWQQGFCIVEYEPGNGIFGQELVNIYGGRAVVNGRVFKGRGRMREIKRDTGWKF